MNIVIVGARADGHAKVVLEILLSMNRYTVAGFIDDDPSKKGQTIRNYPILGSMAELPELIKQHTITGGMVAIGHNAMRRKLSADLEKLGLELVNAIHPTSHFDSDVVIGKGCYIGQGVMVVTGSVIGNAVNIHTGTTIDHDNILADGANLGPGVHTAGRVKIGQDAFLGAGTIVIPDGSVGEGAITGAGSVVLKHVDAYTQVLGIPAKFHKNLNT